LLACFAALSFGSTAWARPPGFSTSPCDTGSGDICQFDLGGTKWQCDTRRPGETVGADMWIVYAGSGESLCDYNDYCAFGYDGDGNDFYCEVTDTAIREVWAVGTDEDDYLSFQYTYNSVFDLDTHSATTLVKGIAFGKDGSDDIVGSATDYAYYEDILHGDAGDDNIAANDGDDEVTGDGGNDKIRGMAGQDTIRGGDGNDHISGGDDGDPVLDGEGGNDTICGDGGTDRGYGGSGTDTVWMGDASGGSLSALEEAFGGTGGSDTCQNDGNTYDGACEATQGNGGLGDPGSMARPTNCPTP
jgi:Ca2+-binding RTX toxin-like protein